MFKSLPKNKTLFFFYFFCGLYIAGLGYFVTKTNTLFLPYAMIPIAIALFMIAFFSFETFVFSIVFFTPLAITLKEIGIDSSVDLSLPTEPFMAAVVLLLPVYQLYSGFLTRKLWRHPVTIIIIIQLVWMAITCVTSEMPLVSVKYLIARLWFVSSSYFMMYYLFTKSGQNILRYLWLYIIPLTGVAVFITVQHASFNFDEHVADWITSPFYNDHTAYGAALAIYLPPLIGFLFMKQFSMFQKSVALACLVVLGVAIFFSFARAAWVGIMAALVVLILLLFRIRFRTLFIIAASSVILFITFQTQILILLSQNNTASGGDAMHDIQSISNIKTDDSNLERINRWSCAFKMFEERPVMGWGPGTYMFQYAPYQKTNEKSKISTNAGTNGNAHSEYLGPLSEQGLLGMLLMLALLVTVFSLGFRAVYNARDRSEKILTIVLLTGLTTYFVHGFLNNFLDTDKLSVPFWGFIAALVAIDMKQKQAKEDAGTPVA